MRRGLVFLLLGLFATNTFARPCFPPGSQFGRFLKTLVTEGEYYGKGHRTTQHAGHDPVTELIAGHYDFSRHPYGIKVHAILCGSRECDELESRWSIRKGCLYVDGRKVNVRRSTATLLRYDYRTDVANVTFELSIAGRSITINGSSTSEEYRSTNFFHGTGR